MSTPHIHSTSNASQTARRSPRVRDESRVIQIQPHDIEVLTELFWNRIMARRHFISLGFWTSVPRANARLRRLFDAGLLNRRFPDACLGQAAEPLYFLGSKGCLLMTEALKLELPVVARLSRTSTSPMFITHTLRVLDLKIAVLTDPASKSITTCWRSELQARHEFKTRASGTSAWTTTIVRPDAYLRLSIPKVGTLHCFLECDLSTESVEILKGKISIYGRYLQTAFKQTYQADTFLLLFVVPSDHRRNLILKLATDQPVQIWCTTFAEIATVGWYGPIWHTYHSRQALCLLPEVNR